MAVERNHRWQNFVFATCFTLIVLAPSVLAIAQPDPGKAQPSRLDFGTVRENATVEGSIRVFYEGDKTEGVPLDVQPPPFATISNRALGTQTYGSFGTRVVCDVSVVVNTQKAGVYLAPIKVKVGSRNTIVPVKVKILPADPSARSVLVVETPFEKFSTEDATLFNSWLRLVDSAELDPHYLVVERNQPILRDLDLAKFDAILLGESGVVFLLESDIAKLKHFVNEGGQLIVTANAFYRGSVEKANALLNLAGLHMTDTEPGDTKSFQVTGVDIATDPLTEAVNKVTWHRPSPIAVTDGSVGRILVKAPPYPDEGFVAVGAYGKGQIAAVGQSLWWNWINDDDSDNQQLLRNLIVETSE